MKVQGHGQAKVLGAEEIKRLVAALKGDRDQTLFALCFFTDCRINEACTRLLACNQMETEVNFS